MKKGKKNRLDEMQEQKMLRIEHNCCWLAFFGLFAVILVQLLYYGMEEAERFAGEHGGIYSGGLYQKRDLGQAVTAVIPNEPVCQRGRRTGRGIYPVPGNLP